LTNTFVGSHLYKLIQAGFGFDRVYYWVFVRPYVWIAQLNSSDFLDGLTDTGIYAFRCSSLLLSKSVNGNLRWYSICICIGAIVILGILILL
jgi:NADH-quinone oxidoreductase subunit L